jgi:hypothetical protein
MWDEIVPDEQILSYNRSDTAAGVALLVISQRVAQVAFPHCRA